MPRLRIPIVLFCLPLLFNATNSCKDVPRAIHPVDTAMDTEFNARSFIATLYEQAIGDFINATDKRDNCRLDTLFVLDRKYGAPDDFPDIELPRQISGTTILKVSMDEAKGDVVQSFKKETPATNIVGWIDSTHAEFVFVVFYPRYQYRFDYHADYVVDSSPKEFSLVKNTFR